MSTPVSQKGANSGVLALRATWTTWWPKNMVIRSHAVHRQHNHTRVVVRCCPDSVTDAVDSCPCGEGQLERCTTGLHHSPNCRANTVAVAMLPMPPSGLLNAVILADMNAVKTQGRTAVLAESSTVNRAKDSRSSRQTFKITLEHLCGPGEHPVGALLKHSAKIFASNFNSRSRQDSRTSAGMSRTLPWGLRRRNSFNVSSKGAKGPADGLETPAAPSSERPALFVVPHFRWCCGILNGVQPFRNHDAPNQPNDLADNPQTFAPMRFFQLTAPRGLCNNMDSTTLCM